MRPTKRNWQTHILGEGRVLGYSEEVPINTLELNGNVIEIMSSGMREPQAPEILVGWSCGTGWTIGGFNLHKKYWDCFKGFRTRKFAGWARCPGRDLMLFDGTVESIAIKDPQFNIALFFRRVVYRYEHGDFGIQLRRGREGWIALVYHGTEIIHEQPSLGLPAKTLKRARKWINEHSSSYS